MPRDASGIYTLPAGNPVVTGTVISSTWANPTMQDIAAQLNNVVTRDGKLGFTQPSLFSDGTAAAPGIAFASEPSTGLYRIGTNLLGVSVGGVLRGQFTNNSLMMIPGTAGAPSYAFTTDGSTGMYFAAGLGFSVSGVQRVAITNTGNVYLGTNNEDDSLSILNLSVPAGPWKEAKIRSTIGGAQFVADGKSPAASGCGLLLRKNGSNRWAIFADNVAEGGGNTGSNFGIARAGDNGLQIDVPININRQTGIVFIKTSLAALELVDAGGTVKDVIDALASRVSALEARP